jgi:hypothetical protein
MDMLGAVIFDFISHQEFQRWSFREFKAYVSKTGRLPVLDRVSQLDFDTGLYPDGETAMATRRAANVSLMQ